jgi:hypothetical protein
MLLQIPQHHLIHDPASESSILIFESQTNGSQNPPFINSLSRSATGAITAHPGKTLGAGESKLLITRVIPGVIIETMEHRYRGDSGFCHYFAIGTELEVIPVASGIRKLAVDQIQSLPWLSNGESVPNVGTEILDNDLSCLFANNSLPLWARSILDAQLEYWNIHHAENYFRYMPGQPYGPEFGRCIKAAPYWALVRWNKLLFPDQRVYCMRRSPAASVAFCFETIPPGRRPQLLAQNPEAALCHGFDQLSEKELAICVTAAPSMAVAMVRRFTPESRARLLGAAVKHCSLRLLCNLPTLQAAIFDSIAEVPDVWLANHDDSLITAFEKMDLNLGNSPAGATLIEFSKNLAPDKQARLLEVVADWI